MISAVCQGAGLLSGYRRKSGSLVNCSIFVCAYNTTEQATSLRYRSILAFSNQVFAPAASFIHFAHCYSSFLFPLVLRVNPRHIKVTRIHVYMTHKVAVYFIIIKTIRKSLQLLTSI